jgi:hypothetical protein
MMVWSYGVALGPWMWLASKERQSGSGGADARNPVRFDGKSRAQTKRCPR